MEVSLDDVQREMYLAHKRGPEAWDLVVWLAVKAMALRLPTESKELFKSIPEHTIAPCAGTLPWE